MGGGCLRGECEDYTFQELQHMDERTDEVVVAGEEESGGDGMITMQGKYQTRDGRAVRILCVDSPNSAWPVVGFAGEDHQVQYWSSAGRSAYGKDAELDLVLVPTKHEGYIVVGKDGFVWGQGIRNTPQEAANEGFKQGDHIAHVTWED
jgi:hypothetical protein